MSPPIYGSLGPAAMPAAPAPSREATQLGHILVAHGTARRGIRACVNCHDPQAGRMVPSFPQFAGHYADHARA